jgi:carboxylesterase type B
VHGGTYVTGASNDFEGSNLVKFWGDEFPGILVTINYRFVISCIRCLQVDPLNHILLG